MGLGQEGLPAEPVHLSQRTGDDEFCELRRTGAHLAEGTAKDTGHVRATVFQARVASSKHVSPLATSAIVRAVFHHW